MQARKMIVVAAAMLLAVGAAGAITIETVAVSDAGNVADVTGRGSVGYAYSIGKYEVTAGQYVAFLNAVAATDTYGLYAPSMDSSVFGCQITRLGVSGSYTYDFSGRPSGTEADWANRPVNFVSYWSACRFTNWLQNGQPTGPQDANSTERGAYTLDGYNADDGRDIGRSPGATWAMPTQDEWYKAAYYKADGTDAGYWMYPTGSDTAPGQDMNDASGNNANYYTSPYNFPIDAGKYTTLVGEFQNSASPYGTFDQGGNLAEWNEYFFFSPETSPATYRGLRGGWYDDSERYALTPYTYGGGAPAWGNERYGFRVAQVPEPASMAMLAIGGLAIFRRRRD